MPRVARPLAVTVTLRSARPSAAANSRRCSLTYAARGLTWWSYHVNFAVRAARASPAHSFGTIPCRAEQERVRHVVRRERAGARVDDEDVVEAPREDAIDRRHDDRVVPLVGDRRPLLGRGEPLAVRQRAREVVERMARRVRADDAGETR